MAPEMTERPEAPPLPHLPQFCVALLIGLPGAGKSSYLAQRGLAGLSTDEMRRILFDDEDDQRSPDLVFSLYRHAYRARLTSRMPRTFLDATNLSPHERKPLIQMATEQMYPVYAFYFDVPLDVCLRRNRGRSRQVPEAVMQKFAKKLRVPSLSEGFAGLFRIDEQGRAEAFSGVQ